MSQHIERVAHRGGSQLAPQNTLAAFRNALTLPVDAIELDVHMSRDGHIIVFHDNVVDKLTNGHGNILDLDFAYLRSLNAAAHFAGGAEAQQIPTLREVLELAKGHVRVYIEIKQSKRNGENGRYPHIVEAVVDDLRATGMVDQVLVMSFDWGLLPQVKALEPSLETGALVSHEMWEPHAEDALNMLVGQVKALGSSWINMGIDLVTPDMPAFFHDAGYKLGIWTVNILSDMQRLAKMGVDSLTSDRPDLFAQLSLLS